MHVSRFMIHSTSIECSDAVQCPVASSLVVQASGETQEYPVGEIAVVAVPESAREHRCGSPMFMVVSGFVYAQCILGVGSK